MRLYGFLEPAQIEFDEAINLYNQQREGLEHEFAIDSERFNPWSMPHFECFEIVVIELYRSISASPSPASSSAASKWSR